MSKGKSVLAVIPARGGSKRVPQKNIRLLAGKPLISYTIKAALGSKLINRLIVSTDNEEIAEIAKRYGAEVPFLRPASLAQDDTPDQPVFKHALQKLNEMDGYIPEIVLNLRPTTPLKTPEIIDRVIQKMVETQADIVRTMTLIEGVHHPYWMYSLSPEYKAATFVDGIVVEDYYQSQLLPKVYRINGVVDGFLLETIANGYMLGNENMFGVVTSNKESIDIDTEFDFNICEALINNTKLGHVLE